VLAVLFVAFFALLVFSVPIAFAMAASAILALALQGQVPLLLVVQRVYAGSDSFPLMAIPFFLIAGEIMTLSRMTDALIELCDSLLSHLRSGLAIVTNVACTAFAAISGSGSADAAAIGSVMIPQLIARGYPAGMAAAIVSAAGALGPIIPPSILMIIYSAIAEQSVGRMFLGGILPGLTISAGLILVSHLMNLRHGWEAGSGERPSMARIRPALWRSLIPLGTPVIIVGGIVGGIFTATEAGVIAAVYALLTGYLYARMTPLQIKDALLRSALLASLSMFVISMASIFGWILAREGFPRILSGFILGLAGDNATLGAVLALMMIMVLGFFIEVIALMVIFVPILAPLGPLIGFDSIHWGLLLVMSMNIGGITPPVGVHLFITASIAKCTLGEVSLYQMPLAAVHMLVVLIVLLVPGLVLWLPRLFFP
jgi:tripartite ATP-independent transporter DctM subunit